MSDQARFGIRNGSNLLGDGKVARIFSEEWPGIRGPVIAFRHLLAGGCRFGAPIFVAETSFRTCEICGKVRVAEPGTREGDLLCSCLVFSKFRDTNGNPHFRRVFREISP